jgi:hypothetical protein
LVVGYFGQFREQVDETAKEWNEKAVHVFHLRESKLPFWSSIVCFFYC